MAKKKIKKVESVGTHTSSQAVPVEQPRLSNVTSTEAAIYTETSYTSASLETLPSVSALDNSLKKKKRAKKSEVSLKTVTSSGFSNLDFLPKIDSKITKKKKKEKKEKKTKEIEKGKKQSKRNLNEEAAQFEKPHNWRKMSDKEKEEWLNQQINQRRMEFDALKAQRKEMRKQQIREQNELLALEAQRHVIRRDILAKTCVLFKKHEGMRLHHELTKKSQKEWALYKVCDGLPNPTLPNQLNTYLRRWNDKTYHFCTEDDLKIRFRDVLTTLELIEKFMSKNYQLPPKTAQHIQLAAVDLRSKLIKAVDCNSFHLLRDVDRNLKPISTKIAIYYREMKELQMHLWVAIRQPTRWKKSKEPPENVNIDIPQLNVTLVLTPVVNFLDITVRVTRYNIDLISSTCRTFSILNDMPNKEMSLYDLCLTEYQEMLTIRKDCDDILSIFYKKRREKIREIEKYIKQNPFLKCEREKAELDAIYLKEPPTLIGAHDPRDRIRVHNREDLERFLIDNMIDINEGEVNLRQYRICGGVLNIDLYETPPQNKYIRHGIYLSTLTAAKELKNVFYRVDYDESKSLVKIPANEKSNPEEAKKDDLSKIYMLPPKNVICFMKPVICQWDPQRCFWTSNTVFDVKYEGMGSTLEFRTKNFWSIGVATHRYANMPYKDWELQKDPDGQGVLFTVTTTHIKVSILCRNRCVILKEIVFLDFMHQDFRYFDQFLGKAMSLEQLKHIMQFAGVDIFPDFDGHNYVNGSCIKNWTLERHLYHCMAFLSKAYSFKRSKWNCGNGCRNITFQMKELVDKNREYKYNLLYAQPESVTYLRNYEDMEVFSAEPAIGMDFYPDLFTFNMSYGSFEARRRSFNMNYQLTEAIFDLLSEVKPFSFG